jgi:5-methylcytosine-specific restriction endonuclease McrA
MKNSEPVKALTDKDLMAQLTFLIATEKNNVLQQIPLIRELFERKIHLSLGYSNFAVYCEESLGLSKSQAWKRCQAGLVARFFPRVWEMLEKGETSVSCVAMLAPKITAANEAAIIDGIRGKNKKEAEFFLSTISHSGHRIDREPTVEIRVELNKEQLAKFEKAKRILGQNRKEISNADVLESALDLLLLQRDPLIKAQTQAKKKRETSATPGELEDGARLEHQSCINLQHQAKSCPTATSPGEFGLGRTRYVPAEVRKQVFLRDEGRCTFVSEDGKRCEETAGLQLDHIIMFCRGGGATSHNLRLLCKNHNIFLSKQALGREHVSESPDE